MWILIIWGVILVLGLGSIVGLILLSLEARAEERKCQDALDKRIDLFTQDW